jgi:hypothetical protein
VGDARADTVEDRTERKRSLTGDRGRGAACGVGRPPRHPSRTLGPAISCVVDDGAASIDLAVAHVGGARAQAQPGASTREWHAAPRAGRGGDWLAVVLGIRSACGRSRSGKRGVCVWGGGDTMEGSGRSSSRAMGGDARGCMGVQMRGAGTPTGAPASRATTATKQAVANFML